MPRRDANGRLVRPPKADPPPLDPSSVSSMVASIRTRITALLNGPYQPSPAAIEAALWPPEEYVAHFRRDGES